MFSYSNYSKIRDSLGFRDANVADATKIPRSTFTAWKQGKSQPRAEKFVKIADFFGCGLDELASGKLREPLPDVYLTKEDLDKIAPAPTPPSDVNPPPLTHREMDLLEVFKDLSDRSQRHLLLYALELYKEQESGEK